MRLVLLFSILIGLVTGKQVSAQSYFPEKAKIIDKSHGLANEFVSEIFEDSKGFIWIGTQNGLCRYDGYEFRTFKSNPNDSFSIPQNWVVEIGEDNHGNIWIAMLRGLAVLDIKTLKFKQVPLDCQETKIDFIMELLIDDHDHIWLNTKNGIYSNILNDSGFDRLYPDEQNKPEKMNGQVLVKTTKGIDIWDTKTKVKKSLNSNEWNAFHKENKKNITLVDYKSIKESNSLLKKNFLHYDLVNHWLESKSFSSHIYYTRKEVWQYDNNQNHHKLLSLPDITGTENNNLINSVLKDKNQNLWIGTEFGIVYLPHELENFKKFSPFQAQKIITTADAVWIGGSQGLYELDLEGGLKKKWLDLRVNTFDIQDEQLIITTAYAQLVTINRKTNKKTISKINPNGAEFRNTFFVKLIDDKVLLGGQSYLIWTDFNFSTIDTLIPFDTIQSNPDITSGLMINKNEFWVGTLSRGIFQYKMNEGKWNPIRNIKIVSKPNLEKQSETIFHLNTDLYGNILISTSSGQSTYSPKNGKLVSIDSLHPLAKDKIMASQMDKGGNIWLSTINDGLVYQNKQTRIFTYYTEAQGLPSDNFLFGSTDQDHNGYMYFGTDRGVIKFNPADFHNKSDKTKDELLLTSIFINDVSYEKIAQDSIKNISYKQSINLSYTQNRLQFYFSKSNISKIHKEEYSYQIYPLDNSWKKWNQGDPILYDRLPPGNYQLQWKSDSQIHSVLDILINPPWYKTSLFVLSVLTILILLSSWIIKKWIRYRLVKQQIIHDQEILNERSKYLSNLAHEIKTPLQLIQGPLEWIKQNVTQFHSQIAIHDLVHLAENQTTRIRSLVKQMELLEKIDSSNLIKDISSVPINLFVKTLIQSLDHKYHAQHIPIVFQSTISDNLHLLIDPSHFTSMVYNLVQNVYDHAKGANSIDIELSYNQARLNIKVSDDGEGVSTQNSSRIFDRFYSQSGKKEGTGLGLAIVNELVESYHGSIQYIARSPQGSIFEIDMPLKENDSPLLNIQQDSIVHLDKNEIVIVDDDHQMGKYLQLLLGSEYTVKTFQSPLAALDYITSIVPDLIISDRIMPELDGILFSSMIKTNTITSHIPIILLSGKDDVDSKLHAYLSDIDIFLAKPFSEKELQHIIQQLISNRIKQRASIQLQLAKDEKPTQTDHPFIKDLTDLIEKEMVNGGLNVEIISHKMMMSRTQLFRKCIAHFGISLQDIIDQKRLARAKRLILSTTDPIKVIALKCGFSDSNYFAKFFKKETGVTALEYRKNKEVVRLVEK